MQTTEIITLSASLCALLISVMLIIGTILGGHAKERVYRWFLTLLIANLLGTCCECLTACLAGTAGQSTTNLMYAIDFFNYAFGAIVICAFAMYLYEYLTTKVAVSIKPFIIAVILNCINMAFLVVAYFAEFFSLVGENNYYDPQNIWLLQMLPAVSMLILVIVATKSVGTIKAKDSASVLIYLILQVLSYIIEVSFPGVWVSYLGSTIAIFIMYINIQVELKHSLVKKEAQLTESRVAIMLTQIKPHFIHNSLLAIQDLCSLDAKEAEKAVKEFSKYLRGNLNSLTNNQTIDFDKELEHLRLYLSLEQRRFEERLQVEFDIQAKDFHLPALTLQPIVENAVLHGITQRVEGGKIVIRTRENANSWQIIVEDTGVGFDASHLGEDSHKHRGIQNVRYRLGVMCGGTLDIQSTTGTGTTAVISIPKGGRR